MPATPLKTSAPRRPLPRVRTIPVMHRMNPRHYCLSRLFFALPAILVLLATVAPASPAAATQPAAQPATPPDAARFDLYLLVGQSNMAGRGPLTGADRAPDPRILVFGPGDAWQLQGEPVHFDKPKAAGVGLGFTFAKLMAAQKPGVTIGLIPCAVGGTPQSRWMPDGDLYKEAVRRARLAQPSGKLRGILWHQGESECGSETKARAYAANLAKIVAGFRRDLDAPDVPFVAGELGEFLYTRTANKSPWARVVNEQIDSLPTLVAAAASVPSHGLAHKGDELHFGADAQREFGKRYAAAMIRLQAAAPEKP